MAEGPQVLRRSEWLHRYLAGRRVLRAESQRNDIPAQALTDRLIHRVFCKGKNIFIELEDDRILYNHLLMRGTWKKLDGAQLFLPEDAWLGLYVGPFTICNLRGQKMELINRQQMLHKLDSLGPDAMATPYPSEEIRQALDTTSVPISEALLNQSILAGVGNAAKSEILFLAKLDPRWVFGELSEPQINALLKAIPTILWNSYNVGGRWDCDVYGRKGEPCVLCGTRIRSMALRPSKRATYFCPRCQGIIS